jgi:hypothetical protein
LRLVLAVATLAILVTFAGVAWLGYSWLDRPEPPRVRMWDMPADQPVFVGLRDCAVCPPLVAVPPGSFRLGASWFERDAQSDGL